MSPAEPRWTYVDFESSELTVERDGVTTTNGRVALARAPAVPETIGEALVAEPALVGLAGIALDAAGNVYVADPERNAVIRIDGCDGSATRVPCLPLSSPRGVAVGRHDELYVSDGGGHRILVVDLGSGQTIGIWGSADPYGAGDPSDAPGLLNEPTDLAVDSEARLYVVDRGNARIQRFSPTGQVESDFWERVESGAPRPLAPEAVAIAALGDEERILVLDRPSGGRLRVLIYGTEGIVDKDRTGRLRDAAAQTPSLFDLEPGGIAAGNDAIYVGDSRRNRILVFDSEGRLTGVVIADHHRAGGYALDAHGRLVVNVGRGSGLRFMELGAVTSGTLRAGPVEVPRGDGESLVGLRFETAELPAGGQFQLYAWLAGDGTGQPPPLDEWLVGPPNSAELVLSPAGSTYLWIAVRLEASEGGGPVLGRARIESGLEAWLYDLPALYARDEDARPFLERLLALLRAGVRDQEQRIEDLPLLFDADTAPDRPTALWLEWLAGWLGFPVGDVRATARRAAVGAAFAVNGRRGTAEGLRELIRLAFAADSWISEPAQRADPWMLGVESVLGFDTALVPAEAQGAVVGVTSTLDRSHVIDDAEFGAPLFDDLAHHFCVGVYASDIPTAEARAALGRLVDREKPAHTTSHICLIEARARVGFQARIGVDSVVAGPAATLHLGEAMTGTADRRSAIGSTSIGERGG